MRFVFLFFSIFLIFPFPVQASDNTVTLYYFWGNGCPHCAAEKPFLEKLKQEYPQLKVMEFEVWYNKDNQALFKRFLEAHNVPEPVGVPTNFIGSEYLVGYDTDATTGVRIEKLVKDCINLGCPDAGEGVIVPTPPPATPGFEALLGILFLLTIYLMRRKWW